MTIVATPPRAVIHREQQHHLFRVASVVIDSSFPFRDLPRAADGEHGNCRTLRVREVGRLVARGELLRELGGDTEHAFRTYENEDGFHWSAEGVGDFLVDPTGASVAYAPHANASLRDVEQVLLGPILGAAFQLMGIPLLHAGAVVVDGEAVAVTAPSGWGKSTLIAHMARLGYPILSDDTLPVSDIDGRVMVQSYVPRMKLYDDSIESIGEDPTRHENQLSWIEKRRVPLDHAIAAPLDHFPLRRIYQLRPQRPGAPIAFKPVPAANATLALAASMYMPDLFTGARGVNRFRAAAAIARAGLYREVHYERSFERLPELARAIIEDARTS